MTSERVEREGLAQDIFDRLHPFMGWLAALFVVVLVGDAIVAGESPFATIFTVTGWAIWGMFVTEFVVRLSIAPDKARFLRRHWWQILFLVLPFLAMLRVFFALRIARAGRLVSAAVRGTRSATANLRGRMLTVGAVTLMVILLGANVLFEFGGISPYASAFYASALTTITGQPMTAETGVAQVMNILLGLYSVVIFAALAGSLGAYFLEKRSEPQGGNVEPGERGVVG